jgi:hypothetical protein
MKKIILLFGCIAELTNLKAQEIAKPKTNEIVLLAGTIQPFLLQGGNFEVNFLTKKMVFEYSHGFSLDLDNKHGTIVGEAKEQQLAIHLPYSTGFGVGYRINKFFNIRFEPKLHKYEVFYDMTDRKKSSNQITSYKTSTLGIGIYFAWKPFEKNTTFLRGIYTSTSIRYWQNVWSSLPNNKIDYVNRVSNKTETHKIANIGIANTPVVINISIGYSIKL